MLAVAATAAFGLVSAAGAGAATAKAAAPQVRVNQVGYASDASKVAYLMLPAKVSSVSFAVQGGQHTYYGTSADDVGSWNASYHAVYLLNFSALHRPGSYRITAHAGSATATSPQFQIGQPAELYHQLVLNAVRYFTSERDGGDVESLRARPRARQPDRPARQRIRGRRGTTATTTCSARSTRIGGPVDVAGGWFDAGGGYEKFAYTASYADGLMLLAARDFPGQYRTLLPEAEYGLSWLERLWHPVKKVLYIQVGIGNGNASNTIQGDYNFWFLPQAEDRMDVKQGGNPGPTAYYVKYRPVFEAAPPGKPISPDFAGRFAADFALGRAAGRHGPTRRGPAPAVAGPRHLRDGQDHPRRPDRDHLPARLLPGHRVEERHALGRRRDGARRRGAARTAAQVHARPGACRALGAGPTSRRDTRPAATR